MQFPWVKAAAMQQDRKETKTMPSTASPASPAFWDRIAQRYAARPISNMDAYEQTMARTRSYLGAEDRVLEIGCGTASTALLLAPHLGHITASDISGEMVGIGREKAWNQSVPNISLVQGTLGDPALGHGPYDAVLAFNLVHLLADTAHAARQVNALLKPGGLFISKTPCLGGRFRVLAPLIAALQLVGKAPFVRYLTTRDLERRIAAAGFEIVETGDYPASPPSHFIVARKLAPSA